MQHNIYTPKIFLTICIISAYLNVWSQCSFTVNAGNDTTLCNGGGTVELNGSSDALLSDILSVEWQPAADLSATDVFDPVADITVTTMYILSVSVASEDNLIINGDFNDGATGFTTEYDPASGGDVGPLSTQGQFDISTDPNDSHVNFASFGDHTSGDGNMLVVNASEEDDMQVWCQEVVVSPFNDYSLDAWAANCHYLSPAILQFTINDIPVGDDLNLPSAMGVWKHFSGEWNSGINTSAEICITDINTDAAGNDFALDDISFNGPCTVRDSMTIFVSPPVTAPVISQSGDSLIADDSYASYAWYKDEVLIPGADTWYYTGFTSGSYVLVVSDENGCTAESSVYYVQDHSDAITISDDEQKVDLYPDPSDGIISIINPGTITSLPFFIVNAGGSVVYKGELKQDIQAFDIRHLPGGFYTFLISTEKGFTSRHFILK